MTPPDRTRCNQTELVAALALEVLPADKIPSVRAHLSVCLACKDEFAAMREAAELLPSWPLDSMQPDPLLWERLSSRIGDRTGPANSPQQALPGEPQWEEVAPGIQCKILAVDIPRDRLTMLVRLAPGTDYPPHTHAGVEELHWLEGELWIDDRRLFPGDYNHAEPDSSDRRVWSQTGCTCMLSTSLLDRVG